MARPVDEKKAQILLNDPVERLIPKMAVPTIIAQLITMIYNLTDTYFVSRLGTNATAAVGVNSTIEQAINMMGMLIGVGASSYIARLLGAKRRDDADRVFSTCMFSGVMLGLVLMAVCLTLITPLVRLLGADANCEQYSIQYGQYVLLAAPFMVISFIMNQCLRSEGSATLAMIGIGFGGILNCALDPIFIFSMGLGIAGASMATAISKVVSCVILLYPYLRKRSTVALGLKKIAFKKEDAREVVSIGSASFVRSFMGVLANTLMNRAAGAYSTAILAAISVSNRVLMLPFNIILGFGQGYQPVAGFNWGARRYDRTEKSLSFAMKVSLIGGILMGAVFFLFAQPIITLFNSAADAEVLEIGRLCIRLQSIVLPVHAFLSVINMFYSGIGRPREAMILGLARQGYCFLPMVYLLPLIFGGTGLAGAQAAADLLSLAVAVPFGLKALHLVRTKRAEQRAGAVSA